MQTLVGPLYTWVLIIKDSVVSFKIQALILISLQPPSVHEPVWYSRYILAPVVFLLIRSLFLTVKSSWSCKHFHISLYAIDNWLDFFQVSTPPNPNVGPETRGPAPQDGAPYPQSQPPPDQQAYPPPPGGAYPPYVPYAPYPSAYGYQGYPTPGAQGYPGQFPPTNSQFPPSLGQFPGQYGAYPPPTGTPPTGGYPTGAPTPGQYPSNGQYILPIGQQGIPGQYPGFSPAGNYPLPEVPIPQPTPLGGAPAAHYQPGYYPPPPPSNQPLWYLGTFIPDPRAPPAQHGVQKVPDYDPAPTYHSVIKAISSGNDKQCQSRSSTNEHYLIFIYKI